MKSSETDRSGRRAIEVSPNLVRALGWEEDLLAMTQGRPRDRPGQGFLGLRNELVAESVELEEGPKAAPRD